MISKCQWNSHYYGGENTLETGCGFYAMYVQNCSGTWHDPGCERWHSKWPGVGMTLGQPISTTTWTATLSLPTLTTTMTGTVTESVV